MQQVHHTSLQQQEQQNQYSRSDTLQKLKVRRLQRSEHRFNKKLQGSADADLPHDQSAGGSFLQPSSHVQQPDDSQKACDKFVQQQAAHVQHKVVQQHQTQQERLLMAPSQHVTATVIRCITTTAGRGMQSRPPSRTGSLTSSLELQQQQQLHACKVSRTKAGLNSSALATAAPAVALQARSTQKASDSANIQVVPQLQIQGLQLQVQQKQQVTQSVWHNTPTATTAAEDEHHQQNKQQSCAPQRLLKRSNSDAAPGKKLGCGIAWGDLADQAVLVAKRSLHHTRQEKEQHRLQLARVVVQQWVWFAHARRQARRAVQHHTRKLLIAGWLGLQQAVSQQQLLQCQATLQAQKHSFMLLSRCFVAWWQQRLQQQHLAATAAVIHARRNRQTLAVAMCVWQQAVDKGRMQRRMLLRSEAYRTLMTMSRGLQAWRTWITDRKLQQLKLNRAFQHWQAVVQRHVLACWQQCVAQSSAKWHNLASALCFHKHKLQTVALRAWQAAAAEQQHANSQAVVLLQQWQRQQQLQIVRKALHCWHWLAQQQLELQQLSTELVHILQQQMRHHVLQHWHSLTRYHQQLDSAAAQLATVSDWWWLQHCMGRWHRMVAVMAGRRTAELRALVVRRAVLGTWLKHTEQQRNYKAALAAATVALQRRRLQRMLAAWQAASDVLAAKHQQQCLAAQHWEQHAKCRLFLQWQDTAAELVLERQHMAAAQQQHHRSLMDRTLQGWSWYCWHSRLKRQAPQVHACSLLTKVLQAWRGITVTKLLKQQRWRQAVRHNYLTTLGKGLSGWQDAVAAVARKQQLVLQAEQQYCSQLQLRALQVWRGPFMQQQQQQLEDAAAPGVAALGLKKQHRVIEKWRQLVCMRQEKQQAATAASAHRRGVLLHTSLTSWRQHTAQRGVKAAAKQLARQHRLAKLTTAVVSTWQLHLRNSIVKRQHMFAAAMHQRSWLARRVWRAWRLAVALAKLECTATQLAQQPDAPDRTGSKPTQQPYLDAVAAAVVAASCASAASWQQQWQKERQHWNNPLYEQAALPERQSPAEPIPCSHTDMRPQQQQQQQPSGARQVQNGQQLQPWNYDTARLMLASTATAPAGDTTPQGAVTLFPAREQNSGRRRPPRLPAFMQSEQQQQQQQVVQPRNEVSRRSSHLVHSAADVNGQQLPWQQQGTTPSHLTASTLQHHHQRQHQQQYLPWQDQASCSSPTRHALQQQQQRQVWQTAYVSRAAASHTADWGSWSTPPVRKARLQPRPLQPSVVGCIPPVVTQQQQCHQKHQQVLALQSTCAECCAVEKRTTRPQLLHEQGQQLVGYHAHDVQLLLVHHEAATAAACEGGPQPCSTPPDVAAVNALYGDAVGWSSKAAGLQDMLTAALAPTAAAAVVGYASGLPDGPAALQQQEMVRDASSSSPVPATQLHQQQRPELQQQRLPFGMSLASSAASVDGCGNQLPQSVLSMPQEQQLRSCHRPDAAAASTGSRVQVVYTPMTRQLLQEEVEAMERALQLVVQLKAALHCRQQQAVTLQQRITTLTRQIVCSSQLMLINTTDDIGCISDGSMVSITQGDRVQFQLQQQQHLQLLLQEAQQQLMHVESELIELTAEKEMQQPRLTAIAERIQQLKAAAIHKQPQQHQELQHSSCQC